jgi:hypothetical protein
MDEPAACLDTALPIGGHDAQHRIDDRATCTMPLAANENLRSHRKRRGDDPGLRLRAITNLRTPEPTPCASPA